MATYDSTCRVLRKKPPAPYLKVKMALLIIADCGISWLLCVYLRPPLLVGSILSWLICGAFLYCIWVLLKDQLGME